MHVNTYTYIENHVKREPGMNMQVFCDLFVANYRRVYVQLCTNYGETMVYIYRYKRKMDEPERVSGEIKGKICRWLLFS